MTVSDPQHAAPQKTLESRLTPRRLQVVLDVWRAAGRRTEIPVEGRSMFPLLRTGWSLVLDHGATNHPFGCIIVFLQGRTLVAHRVVGRHADGRYRTKGDALLHEDQEWVMPDKVLGRVVALRQPDGLVSLESGRQRFLGRLVALISRGMAAVHKALAPLRRLGTGTPGAGRVPGPTRVLGAGNRLLMVLAARLMGSPQSSGRDSPGDASGEGGA